MKNELLKGAERIFEEIKENYYYLHQNAETGFNIENTAAFIKNELTKIGCEYKAIGNNGIIAELGDKSSDRCVLLRADTDALPIKEESGKEYSCKNGNMHACGHDMHASMLLGCARILKRREEELAGRVCFLFQPAEELLEGAKNMIESGLIEYCKPDAAFMIHVMTGTEMKTGFAVVSSGGVSAPSADYFRIKVKGKGTHGASAADGVDPITALCHIIIALEEIIARELKTGEKAALTIGKICAGSAGNVIPEQAEAEGSMRCFDETVREFMKQRVIDIAKNVAKAFRGEANVEFYSGCPALKNSEELSALCYEVMSELFGKDNVMLSSEARGGSMSAGSEDFAYIAERIPSVMMALSAGSKADGYVYPLHNPKAVFDTNALIYGSAAYAGFALGYLLK